MAQTRPCDVRPLGDQDKYSLALMNRAGEWYGLDIPLAQIYPNTINPPVPLQRVSTNSFHGGRGLDKFVQGQNAFFDSYNGWSTTPGKYHATLLQKWGSAGLFTQGVVMPSSGGGVQWKPLIGATRYISAVFGSGAAFTGTRLTFLIRKQVPAGTTGAPGNLTVEVRNDDGAGAPGTVIQSVVIAPSDIPDVVSRYYTVTINVSFVVATYHIAFSGGANDKKGACWEVGCSSAISGFKSSTGGAGTWLAFTNVSPYFKIDAAVPKWQLRPFVLDGALYLVAIYDDGTTASRLFLNGNRGRATGTQTASALTDTTHGAYGATALPTNRFKDAFIRIIRNTGKGQVRQITGNNSDTYNIAPDWDIPPVSGSSEYVVYANDTVVEIGSTGLGVVTGEPVIQNGIVYFPQGDSTIIRKMRIDYADADVHAWAAENVTGNNKGYFLEAGFDNSRNEPVVWRANQSTTTGSTPNAQAISVSRASSAPGGVAVPFTVDLIFTTTNVLVGENTNLITNIYEHEAILYVFKEDGLFVVQSDRAVRVKMGVEAAPDVDNGRAAVTAGDKNLYVAFRNDVYMVTGGGAYSTGLKNNLPSNRSGPVVSLIAAEGWVFAAINGGANNYSSVMKFSLDTKTWSEQWRGHRPGGRVRNLQWQPCPETHPRLWIDYDAEMIYQEFPINGVRPYDDKSLSYQHETVIELPTIDLGTTDPKYFAVLAATTQGLAQDIDPQSGHLMVVECQVDNKIGSSDWEHVDYIKTSPFARVVVGRGSRQMIRPRLRLISNEALDPVFLETLSLTLFTRNQLAHEWRVQFPLTGDDEEQNSTDLLLWLRKQYSNAEPLTMFSRFTLYDNRQVTLADEPKYQITELDQPDNELEAQVWMKLSEVI